jgi:hypothetical protein
LKSIALILKPLLNVAFAIGLVLIYSRGLVLLAYLIAYVALKGSWDSLSKKVLLDLFIFTCYNYYYGVATVACT